DYSLSNHVFCDICCYLHFVYTDSEPGRAFWGADDEEYLREAFHGPCVLGIYGLLIQPVAHPAPDYIPGPEDPTDTGISQDERMSIEFPAEEQLLTLPFLE
ncbi:hypothetical protein Tco_0632302, partial [Tanacetum coccineum]